MFTCASEDRKIRGFQRGASDAKNNILSVTECRITKLKHMMTRIKM